MCTTNLIINKCQNYIYQILEKNNRLFYHLYLLISPAGKFSKRMLFYPNLFDAIGYLTYSLNVINPSSNFVYGHRKKHHMKKIIPGSTDFSKIMTQFFLFEKHDVVFSMSINNYIYQSVLLSQFHRIITIQSIIAFSLLIKIYYILNFTGYKLAIAVQKNVRHQNIAHELLHSYM